MNYNHFDMLPEQAFKRKLFSRAPATLEGGGGSSGGGESTTQQGIDPLLKPYVNYGLTEAQKLYQTDSPEYYGGKTYISPSDQTSQAFNAAETRALAGNPLLPSAQAQQQGVIGGDYLRANPYFDRAMAGAATGATTTYNDAIAKAQGAASQAGRYGSNVSADIQNRAATTFGNTLANKYGEMAYQNYGDERGRQEAAAINAPALAQADYGDINQLLQVGQGQEQYQSDALQADLDRFNFEQNQPYAKLQTYLGSVYGAPSGSVSTTTQSGGGGKIVCTAMNHVYGFGSFRQKIWLAQSKDLHPAYEKGYHTLFMPLIFFGYRNDTNPLRKLVRGSLEHVARHRTADIWKQKHGKRDTLGRIYRSIIEPICFVVGKVRGA
tara:strand:+ start:2640 stop:3779 length:1140 start_codon:yes stop_codon:yes gene_type:complete